MPKKVSSKKNDKPKSTKKPSWWKEHQEFLKKFKNYRVIRFFIMQFMM